MMNEEVVGKVLKGYCDKEYECMGKGSSMVAGGAGEVILRTTYSDGGVRDICGGGQLSAWCVGSFSMFHGASLA